MAKVEIEKRSCVRFMIPGASLKYKVMHAKEPENLYAEEFCPLIDVSRGGICFLSKEAPNFGSGIYLKVSVPNENIPFVLKGIIRWVGKFGGANFNNQIGVQFHPYGDESPEQNYPGILVKIIALEQIFAPNNTIA